MNLITDKEKFEKFKIADRNPQFFVEEFYKVRRNCTSNIQAFDEVEKQHEELTGRQRYSDYESFRRTKQRVRNRG